MTLALYLCGKCGHPFTEHVDGGNGVAYECQHEEESLSQLVEEEGGGEGYEAEPDYCNCERFVQSGDVFSFPKQCEHPKEEVRFKLNAGYFGTARLACRLCRASWFCIPSVIPDCGDAGNRLMEMARDAFIEGRLADGWAIAEMAFEGEDEPINFPKLDKEDLGMTYIDNASMERCSNCHAIMTYCRCRNSAIKRPNPYGFGGPGTKITDE